MLINIFSSKKDLPKLASLGDFLKECSSAMGLYKVLESCEMILEESTIRSKSDSASQSDGREDISLSRIEDEIGNLKDSLCFARRAFDSFYKRNVA